MGIAPEAGGEIPAYARRVIFHLAPAADWAATLDGASYPRSSREELFADVGFVHASTAEQLPGVVERFYRDEVGPLMLLTIDETAVESSGVAVLWEGRSDRYPHVYAPLRPEWVLRAESARIVDGALVLD